MVDLNTSYELNTIYQLEGSNAEISIGSPAASQQDSLTLYEKGAVIAGDMDKLPIMRSLSGSWSYDPAVLSRITASGFVVITVKCEIFNGEYDDDDWKIAEYNGIIQYDAGRIAIEMDDLEWGLAGGVVLFNKLHIKTRVVGNTNAAGAAFPAETVNYQLFIEVDWKKVTKAQKAEYIEEAIFSRVGD